MKPTLLPLALAMAGLLACGGGSGASSTPTATTYSLKTVSAPVDNPLKGFVPFAGDYTAHTEMPHSMEFTYVPLSAVQTGYTTFDWSSLETQLDTIAARGHQAVLRFYLDYPDTSYGMPSFLSGVAKHSYTDYSNGVDATSYCPDYTDADLKTALGDFIAALGARYDGDQRIAFLQVGLLGFWGEWHTYPHTDWTPSAGLMEYVLDAFQAGFSNTVLLMREPKTGVTVDRPRLGFHDDSFCYNTLGSETWYFWPQLQAAGLSAAWRTRPIGGELRPELQTCIWDAASCAPSGQDFATSVSTTHASWMINQGFFATMSADQRASALVGARSLGYELYVDQAVLQPVQAGGSLSLTIHVQNLGVAPFYYPWTVKVGVLDATGTLHPWDTAWDLRTVIDSAQTWSHTVASPGLSAGTYRLVVGVPGPNGTFLRFANATQDQDLSGWLTVGSFQVK